MMMRGLYDACLLGERGKRIYRGEEEDIWVLRGKGRDLLTTLCFSLATYGFLFEEDRTDLAAAVQIRQYRPGIRIRIPPSLTKLLRLILLPNGQFPHRPPLPTPFLLSRIFTYHYISLLHQTFPTRSRSRLVLRRCRPLGRLEPFLRHLSKWKSSIPHCIEFSISSLQRNNNNISSFSKFQLYWLLDRQFQP